MKRYAYETMGVLVASVLFANAADAQPAVDVPGPSEPGSSAPATASQPDSQAVAGLGSAKAAVNWTMEEIRCRPHAYFEAVIAALEGELRALQPAIDNIEVSVDELTAQIAQKRKLYADTRQLAEECRREYQVAKIRSCWPVEIRGEQYTEERLESQLSRIMAQAEALRQAIVELQDARERAEGRLEPLISRPTRLEAQIIVARALQRLHVAQQIESRGVELMENIATLVEPDYGNNDLAGRLAAIANCPPLKPIDSQRRVIARRYLQQITFDAPQSKDNANRKPEQRDPIFVQKH